MKLSKIDRLPRNDITKKILKELYINQGKSSRQIAKELNCSKALILRKLKNFNISIRYVKKKKIPNLIGKTFMRLMVIGYVGNDQWDRVIWHCECKCGNTLNVLGQSLRSGHTQSCGCLNYDTDKRTKHKTVGCITGSLFGRIKIGAIKRGLEFSITQNFISELFLQQQGRCALSGLFLILPQNYNEMSTGKSTASLDRIDNNKGYTENNVQWVYKKINLLKSNLVQKEFLELCKLVTDYQRNKNI